MLLAPYRSLRIDTLCDAAGHTSGGFIGGGVVVIGSREGKDMGGYSKDLLG